MADGIDIPQIVLTRGGAEVVRRSLDRSGIRLGRDRDNDLALDDPSVAGKHAVIVQEAGRWWIRCPNDEQGLRVAGRTCQSHPLTDGDRIGIGVFELHFHVPAQVAPDPDRTRVFDGSDSLDVHVDEAPARSIQVSGYEIIREVGRGGMGRVFQAVQISTRRTVAFKIMLEGPFTDAKTKRRFEREVHIVASLRHPNVAQIYESGLHEGRYWFAMEFVDGRALDAPEVVSGLSLSDRLALMATVCEAVGHAHDQRIVHRDLKPSNILISKDGQPHILDFGLAKVQDPKRDPEMMLSLAGELMGTPAYMSPEQTQGDPGKVDARADVYSLGVILYQLLTGQFPYDVRGRLDQVIHQIATTDPTRPSQIRKEIDSEAEAIILKAIAKDPDERYPSAKAMGQDLRRLLAGEPIEAKLTSRTYVLTKTLARIRWPLVGAAVLGVAVVTSVLVTRAWVARSPKAPRTGTGAATTIAEAPEPAKPSVTESPAIDAPPLEPRRDPSKSATAPRPPQPGPRGPATQPAAAPLPTTVGAAPRSHPSGPAAQPAVTSPPATMSAEMKERRAQTWLARLSSLMARGDYLRAHLALERLRSRFSDVPDVVRSADRLKLASDRIEAKLGPGALRDAKHFVVHSPPSNTAQWQAAMTIAQEIVATDNSVGIVVLRIMLESETAQAAFQVTGQGVALYGGKEVTPRRNAESGDILFIGPADPGGRTPGIKIDAAHHHSATIGVAPKQGEVTRFGDVVVRESGS